MTRFARAKGAAASNERVEEEATPWHQMVKHIRNSSNSKVTAANRDVEDLDGDLAFVNDEDNSFPPPRNTIELPSRVEEEDSSEEEYDDINNGKLLQIRMARYLLNDFIL